MIDEMTTPTTRSTQLQLPLQAAPIDRTQSPASAVASEGGVEAAFGWPEIFDIAKTAIPMIASAVSDRRLKRDVTPVEWSR